jgi:hypothetical protein
LKHPEENLHIHCDLKNYASHSKENMQKERQGYYEDVDE